MSQAEFMHGIKIGGGMSAACRDAENLESLAAELEVEPVDYVPALALSGLDGRRYDWLELMLAHVRLLKSAPNL